MRGRFSSSAADIRGEAVRRTLLGGREEMDWETVSLWIDLTAALYTFFHLLFINQLFGLRKSEL